MRTTFLEVPSIEGKNRKMEMERDGTENKTLLEMREVSKTFRKDGSDVLVLQDVNFSICEGEFVCILGPTGCGKSVTLQIVAGLIEQTTGSVILDGKEEHGPGPHKGMVFQEYALLPWRSVVENVEIGLELRGIDKKERRRIALEQLATVGLSGSEEQKVHEISVGMRQRVAIARALANDPKILLMDEPFEALDALTKEEMQIQILKVWERTGTTILFVTHDVDEAIFLSDRICVMDINPGRVKKMLVNQLPRPRHECVSRTDKAFNDMRDEIIKLYSSLKEEELDLII
ncbi:MAG: ABC transporter ATP-binding protein [Chlorobium sp.]|nr:ABC transporter ATP-binding protein [Chlorobium sp.]MCW8815268.1 ABC transporter ATP-binding protein [Chlorobium sp.]MCW8819383.1 ABC transporter ATP-binding protein [Ignavibacteriaceae bacterium]